MKQYGFVGKGTGKLGASVFAISGGEQIVRQYNPVVSNPNTDAQVEQRAKLKLMSQLAAALAPALAFKKQGLVSARNQFVSKNIGLVQYENDKARVALEALALTPGSVAFSRLEGSAGQGGAYDVHLATAAAANIDTVVYVAVVYDEEEPIKLVDVKGIAAPGDGRTFPTSFTKVGDGMTIYAYGLIGAAGSSKTSYNDYYMDASGNTGYLEVLQTLIKSATSTTQTSSVVVSL